MRVQAAPVPLTDRDRRQTAQEEAAREAQRMAEEMAAARVKAIESSLQQQLQQRDETIKRQQKQNEHQQELVKRQAAELQRLARLIADLESASAPPMPPHTSANKQTHTTNLHLEVSSTGKRFTWKKTRGATVRLRGNELSWWTTKDKVQSCTLSASVDIIFPCRSHKNKVTLQSKSQQIFLQLFFDSAETAKTWQRCLKDARAAPDGGA